VPPKERGAQRQRSGAEETVRTEARESKRAGREAEPEHDLTDLRRARGFRPEPEAGRE